MTKIETAIRSLKDIIILLETDLVNASKREVYLVNTSVNEIKRAIEVLEHD